MSDTPLNESRQPACIAGWLQPDTVVMVHTTAPDALLAKRLAHELVEEHLAACAHVGSPVVAMYMWEGKLEGGDEVPVTFKTSVACTQSLIEHIKRLHPYQVPEILVIPVAGGDPAYMQWVQEQVGEGTNSP